MKSSKVFCKRFFLRGLVGACSLLCACLAPAMMVDQREVSGVSRMKEVCPYGAIGMSGTCARVASAPAPHISGIAIRPIGSRPTQWMQCFGPFLPSRLKFPCRGLLARAAISSGAIINESVLAVISSPETRGDSLNTTNDTVDLAADQDASIFEVERLSEESLAETSYYAMKQPEPVSSTLYMVGEPSSEGEMVKGNMVTLSERQAYEKMVYEGVQEALSAPEALQSISAAIAPLELEGQRYFVFRAVVTYLLSLQNPPVVAIKRYAQKTLEVMPHIAGLERFLTELAGLKKEWSAQIAHNPSSARGMHSYFYQLFEDKVGFNPKKKQLFYDLVSEKNADTVTSSDAAKC